MTNLEIEDVLSSIRRLVSEDVPKGGDRASGSDGRFVLTPALRVSDEADTAQIADQSAPDSLLPDLDEEPAVNTLQSADAAESDVYSLIREDGPDREASPLAASPQADETPGEASEPATVTLETRIAELEEAVGRTREEWEPDGSEPDAGTMPKWHIYQAEGDKDPDGSEPAEQADHEDQTTDVDRNPVFLRTGFSSGRQVPEITASDDDRDHDADSQDDDPTKTAPQLESVPDTGVKSGEDDEFIDESALRTMVTEIVRQELRGSTGERITRNMRRMVRREIQRAIALKDVD